MVLKSRYAINANNSKNVVPSLYISNILYQIGGVTSSQLRLLRACLCCSYRE